MTISRGRAVCIERATDGGWGGNVAVWTKLSREVEIEIVAGL